MKLVSMFKGEYLYRCVFEAEDKKNSIVIRLAVDSTTGEVKRYPILIKAVPSTDFENEKLCWQATPDEIDIASIKAEDPVGEAKEYAERIAAKVGVYLVGPMDKKPATAAIDSVVG